MSDIESNPTILIIDDSTTSRQTLKMLLAREAYQLYFAENGFEGIDQAITVQPDVILLDIMMPKMDGFEFCRQVRAMPLLAEVPILIITTLSDPRSRLTGLQVGADDFISKPFDSLELKARLSSLTRLNRYRQIVRQRNELSALNQDLLIAYDETIEGWAQALDLRDKETEGHTRRVTENTVRLARLLGIDETQIKHIWRGAMLHDVGKLGIPDSILLKPEKLTEAEWQVMRKHTEYARRWLEKISYLRPALDIPAYHHEKWDGSGYPNGYKGTEIPLAARIFALVDVWDALTNDRPYRAALTTAEALEYIQAHSGTHFDPDLVSVFIASYSSEITPDPTALGTEGIR